MNICTVANKAYLYDDKDQCVGFIAVDDRIPLALVLLKDAGARIATVQCNELKGKEMILEMPCDALYKGDRVVVIPKEATSEK